MNIARSDFSESVVPFAAPSPLLGDSEAMQEVFRLIERVGPTEASVLLTGESGSGKELAAQSIHDRSPRRGGPFLAINCGAIPAGLIEAELFGYEKGSFTGAIRAHAGVFERAQGGTLLLDEVTEMPLDMQTRLLRVLESRKFYRVGASIEFSSDVRVIASTNRCPLQAVQNGRLREDLLYRLAVFPIDMPPLRRRGTARRAFPHGTQRAEPHAEAAVRDGTHDVETAYLARKCAGVEELHRTCVHTGRSNAGIGPAHSNSGAQRGHGIGSRTARYPGGLAHLRCGAFVDRSHARLFQRQQTARSRCAGLQPEDPV
jgi:transcriptional regulator of acetoin/glycerol metabolism